MGKFKIGDRVRVLPRDRARAFSGHGASAGNEYTVKAVRGDGGDNIDTELWSFFDHEIELVPTFTITTDTFYRTRSGKVTGRVSKGDTGFEAVVDGKVRIYDAAGGHVHGDTDLDIVEAWVPRVGERVRFVRDSTAGGARFGRKGDTATVAGDVREGNNVFGAAVDVKVDYSSIGFNPGAYLSDLEPLPVAAPQPALVIEAGKFYRTRDGRKVGPMGICLWGGFYDTARRVTGQRWEANGTFIKGQISNLDLIAEWQETTNVGAQVDTLAEEYGSAKVAAASNDNAAGPKFKVGDRVVVTCNKTNGGVPIRQYVIGGVYPITSIVKDLNGNDAVMLNNHHQYIKQDQFGLATTAIVALIEDGQPKPAVRPYVHASEEAAATEAKRLAGVHKGKQFGVFVLASTAEEAKPTYSHEWQRLAAGGQKIAAIKELRSLTGMMLKPAKDVVEHFADYPYGQAA